MIGNRCEVVSCDGASIRQCDGRAFVQSDPPFGPFDTCVRCAEVFARPRVHDESFFARMLVLEKTNERARYELMARGGKNKEVKEKD